MSAGRICVREVWVARPDETVREAARRMAREGVGTLVVTDAERRVLGVVTDRDLVSRCLAAACDPEQTQVAAVMSVPALIAHESTSVEDLLATMARSGVRRLPVVEDAGERLVGIVSLDDVLELLAEEMERVGGLVRKRRPALP